MITKAEMLWTRVCPLQCDYCAMADGRKNSIVPHIFQQGVDNLKQLDCKFIAFYGAEPLADFDNLPSAIQYVEEQGIDTTVITSGATPKFFDKLQILYGYGLRSLTMSHDIVPLNKWSQRKSDNAIRGLQFFQSLGDYRDVAIVVTLTSKNYTWLIDTIREMSSKNIWTFFDIIHPDRYQPGSKCRNVDSSLLFQEEDFPRLQQILHEVASLKTQGYLCHSSHQFINMISYDDFDLIKNYNWNCAKEVDFPAWVTIDCDGLVYPCDDFQLSQEKKFHMSDLYARWDEFCVYWRNKTLQYCPGCCWNTHIDAHLVKRGILPITDYVHGLKGDHQ